MKTRFAFRTFLLLCMLCIWGGANCAFAQETTTVTDELTVTSLGMSAGEKNTYSEFTSSVFDSGAQYKSNACNDGTYFRIRTDKNNSGIVVTTTGGKVKSLKVTFNQSTAQNRIIQIYGKNSAYAATTDLYDDDKQGTLLGSLKRESKSVDETKELPIEGSYKYIGIKSSSKVIYITSIEVVWEPTTEYQPEAPTINPSTQTFSKAFTATITAEGSADIYYTTDGSEPTIESTKYESGVEIPAATTTLKAIAVKDGVASDVTSVVYTYEYLDSFDNLKALRGGGVTGTKYNLTFNDAVVTYVNEQNAYIQDATGGMLIYYKNRGHGLTAGQKLNGTTAVTYTIYNGQCEITEFTKSDLTITDGATITETEVTLADLLADMDKYADMRVKVTNVTVTSEFSNKFAKIEQNGSSITVYDKASTTYENMVENYIVNVVGYPVVYSNVKEINVWSSDDVTLVKKPADYVDTPTISPESQTFSEAFTATITSDAAGVMYTLDGTDPSYENNKGELLTESPFTVDIPAATTTLKVIAVDDDGNESEVATAVYTYLAPLPEDAGTFDNPLTPEQLITFSSNFSGKKVWVKGNILGQAYSSGNGYKDGFTESNIAIGESGLSTCIAVKMEKNSDNISYASNVLDYTTNTALLNAPILVYGTVGKYFGRMGISSMIYFAFPGETLSVNTEEGYSTYYCTTAPTLMPTGVNAGPVTISNDKMTIVYKYKGNETLESGELIPASMPVLIKAEKKGTYPLIYSAKNKGTSDSNNNLVGQETTGTITAEDGYYYYKLAYDDYTAKTDLGFYWGAEDGGVFSVPAGKAYLKVAKTADVAVTAYRFDGSTVTAIGNVVADGAQQQVKSAYTIDGRRVDANRLTKGIYIVNGKKVVVK